MEEQICDVATGDPYLDRIFPILAEIPQGVR